MNNEFEFWKEYQALCTEREAMQMANLERMERGESSAYGESEFLKLAEKFRKLKTGD